MHRLYLSGAYVEHLQHRCIYVCTLPLAGGISTIGPHIALCRSETVYINVLVQCCNMEQWQTRTSGLVAQRSAVYMLRKACLVGVQLQPSS